MDSLQTELLGKPKSKLGKLSLLGSDGKGSAGKGSADKGSVGKESGKLYVIIHFTVIDIHVSFSFEDIFLKSGFYVILYIPCCCC